MSAVDRTPRFVQTVLSPLSQSLLLQIDPPPTLSGIETCHLARQRRSVHPKIFSVHEAFVMDDEGLNSGYPRPSGSWLLETEVLPAAVGVVFLLRNPLTTSSY
jgi:hypothetical protein